MSTIGTVLMLDDGTLDLQLRAFDGNSLGDARINIRPGPLYDKVLTQVGGLVSGQIKQIPAFK